MFAKQSNSIMASPKCKLKPIYLKWDELIQSKGLKQTWVSERVGISPPHLSNILAGRAFITPETKAKINEVLGVEFN